MKSFALISTLAVATIANAGPTPTENELPKRADTLPTVTASGNAFWTGSDRFYLRGIDYQPGGSSGDSDPLADTTICKRDIAKFKELGVNTIRVYMVDNSKTHDDCMKELANAGIYLVLDVNNPKYSINRYAPSPSYNDVYLQSVFATVEEFAGYTNTLAFFSGNEVINEQANSTLAAPYVKAVTRDIKQYMSGRKLRAVPVGYSAADVASNRQETADYFNCGSDDARSDFFAFNDYSWCSPSSFQTSGWDQKVKNFTDYGLPIFLSEWGCIANPPRTFEELGSLMSDDMSAVYSGGLVYEYSSEGNGYGVVKVSGSDATVTEGDDFGNLKSALSKYPAPTGSGGAVSTTHSVTCPTAGADWQVEDDSLPAIPEKAKDVSTLTESDDDLFKTDVISSST
ncbi:glycolipid anchored surface protein [Truncatella angustata]|uniref:1,3-beta-glucanosyltransferase n=1 Tax=Truncatella angustata TaxID=152316 RepID=A0A9P8ZVU5_9PEZI|nr:glycolipid anchored surface protein [Truncatella angustata]KAH6652950.1 glycolipid anchored surface protein [Truncatella angustata]